MTIGRVSEELPDGHGRALLLWCPGCEETHQVHFGGTTQPQWFFDGNLEAPTIGPSILVRGGRQGSDHVCHAFIRAGQWEYLTDSTHKYAGRTIPCQPHPHLTEGDPS